jgi:hypothetical protein
LPSIPIIRETIISSLAVPSSPRRNPSCRNTTGEKNGGVVFPTISPNCLVELGCMIVKDEVEKLRKQKDNAYWERNQLIGWFPSQAGNIFDRQGGWFWPPSGDLNHTKKK